VNFIGLFLAHNVAIADALHAPVVEIIQTENYTGKKGDPIGIRATDNFKVACVVLSIHDRNSVLLEEGKAVVHENDENEWIYFA
jgi:hypothetical protein